MIGGGADFVHLAKLAVRQNIERQKSEATLNSSTNNRTTNNRTISVKNDNDLTARQLLRVIEIQIFRSDFETTAYSSVRSLFPQLSIECCFFHFREANWHKISEFLNSDAHPNIWTVHRGESLSKNLAKP